MQNVLYNAGYGHLLRQPTSQKQKRLRASEFARKKPALMSSINKWNVKKYSRFLTNLSMCRLCFPTEFAAKDVLSSASSSSAGSLPDLVSVSPTPSLSVGHNGSDFFCPLAPGLCTHEHLSSPPPHLLHTPLLTSSLPHLHRSSSSPPTARPRPRRASSAPPAALPRRHGRC